MNKKLLKRLVSLSLVLTLAFSTSTVAQAAKDNKDTNAIFSEAEVLVEIEKAKTQKLQSDKVSVGISSDFSINAIGTYPTRKGVILVTADKMKGIIPTGHAAIIYTSTSVVESLSGGVVTGANNWNTTRSSCYGVTVIGTTTTQDSTASNWCYAQRGKPYNWNYLDKNTRSKFYCSQLVYAAFMDNYGINLDTSAFLGAVHPMELVNTSKTSTIYQK